MNKALKIILIVVLSVVALFSAALLYLNLSAYPTAWIVRKAFSSTSYTSHENQVELNENVTISKDITYPSKYKNNNLKVIIPNNLEENTKVPVVIWVHGGAFVAGDKKDVQDYLVLLANSGYVIVNINYELAPKRRYPGPLVQLGEAYKFINEDTTSDYIKHMDKTKIIFGGDSAGAHIASQYINIQTNSEYAELLGLEQTINPDNIFAALLFAGPYDFDLLSNLVKKVSLKNKLEFILSFVAKRIGYAYLGDRNWKGKDKYDPLTIKNYVTGNYPPTFLTDGKTGSFQPHSEDLAFQLRSKGVSVTEVYYDAELFHEYQFQLGTVAEDGRNYALETFDKTIEFLKSL